MAVPLGLLAVGALVISVVCGVGASAAPRPTVAQVKARLGQLNSRLDLLVQRYDQVQQELAAAGQRLARLSSTTGGDLRRFRVMRAQVAQIAAAAYENGQLASPGVLLTSGTAQQVLDRASILAELSWSGSAAMRRFLAAARQLTGGQRAALRTRQAKAALRARLAGEKTALEQALAQQRALLARVTPEQRAGTGPGTPAPAPAPAPSPAPSPTPGPGTGGGHTPPPVSGAAAAAVQFAYNQLGCPYVWGGTGPCHQGFDCSGLTQAAWAAAGVSIPRVSWDQMGGLPAVSTSELQPGDILGFNGNEHVGIYVGGGMLIDAPMPGQSIEKVALSGWYSANLDGAVRP